MRACLHHLGSQPASELGLVQTEVWCQPVALIACRCSTLSHAANASGWASFSARQAGRRRYTPQAAACGTEEPFLLHFHFACLSFAVEAGCVRVRACMRVRHSATCLQLAAGLS